jgi:hypothetical protein
LIVAGISGVIILSYYFLKPGGPGPSPSDISDFFVNTGSYLIKDKPNNLDYLINTYNHKPPELFVNDYTMLYYSDNDGFILPISSYINMLKWIVKNNTELVPVDTGIAQMGGTEFQS